MLQDEGRMAEFWNKRSGNYANNIEKDNRKKRTDEILELLEEAGFNPKGSRVLDIGCGPGTLTLPLSKLGAEVTALDISSGMLDRLKDSVKKESLPVDIVECSWWTADIDELGFRNKFDLVIASMGGGHGLYSIAFAKMNEQLKAFVFDLPPVTIKTKQYIEKYGASNVDVIPGDFFKDELGTGYDLIFSSFNPGGKAPELIPKIASALNYGGVFVTLQVPDENTKSDPLFSLDWNLWTFEDTKKGGTGYCFENSVPFNEYIGMLGDYGLEVFRTLDMTPIAEWFISGFPTSAESGPIPDLILFAIGRFYRDTAAYPKRTVLVAVRPFLDNN